MLSIFANRVLMIWVHICMLGSYLPRWQCSYIKMTCTLTQLWEMGCKVCNSKTRTLHLNNMDALEQTKGSANQDACVLV